MDHATTELIEQISCTAGQQHTVFGIVRQIMSVVDGPLDVGQDLNAAVEATLQALLASSTPVDWTALAEHYIAASREPERPIAVMGTDDETLLTCGATDCGADITHAAEDGYARSWSLLYKVGNEWMAFYGGSEDFSESGDGVTYLTCTEGHENAMPAAMKLDYR